MARIFRRPALPSLASASGLTGPHGFGRLTALRAALSAAFASILATRRRAAPWAAVDFSAQHMAAVLVAPPKGSGKPRVLKAVLAELAGGLPEAAQFTPFAQALEAGARQWTLLLPRDEYRISVMAEPVVPAAELAQSVRWQLAPALDFPAEDASVDFMKIPTRAWEPERVPELYVVAARGDAVRQRAALFDQARLSLGAIDIRETAQRNIAALVERDGELLVMIAFCADDVQISFSWHGELYMDRLIAESAARDTPPDRRAAANERIASQVQRSIEAVRASFPFMQAARVLVAGAPEDFCTLLASSIDEPVESLQPEQLFDLSHTPELREPQQFMQYFHALGAALRTWEPGA